MATRLKLNTPTAASAGGKRIFVSYSHRDGPQAGDGDVPGDVFDALKTMTRDPALGLDPKGIFFDRDSLLAGERWNDGIESAIRTADVFLFLVSTRSLASDFCVERELALALEIGVPLIVPVLLSRADGWRQVVVPGTPPVALGDFDAVPKDAGGNLEPIIGGRWPARQNAISAMAAQLARRLLGTREEAAPPAAVPAPALPRLPPLLPLLCNQADAESSFNAAVRGWKPERATLVFVKGVWDDLTEGFWKRLAARNLVQFSQRHRLDRLPTRPLVLRTAMDGTKVRKTLADDVRSALSKALFAGDPFRLDSAADLAAVLEAQAALQPLVTTLPAEAPEGLSHTLHELLQIIEDTPAGAPLGRLVIAALVEDAALVAEPNLRKRLRLGSRFKRTEVVELEPLKPVTLGDVRDWHVEHELERRISLTALQAKVFGAATTMRMRPFDAAVTPLLGAGLTETREE